MNSYPFHWIWCVVERFDVLASLEEDDFTALRAAYEITWFRACHASHRRSRTTKSSAGVLQRGIELRKLPKTYAGGSESSKMADVVVVDEIGDDVASGAVAAVGRGKGRLARRLNVVD